jgi:monosaccharide-transporting ATPase
VMRDGRTVMTSRMADVDKLHLIAAMLGRDLEAVRERATGFRGTSGAVGDEVLAAEGLVVGRKVRDARLEVRAGQIVGLAGLLGSGRTEVARAIFGADPPDAGAIRLMGKAASPREPVEAIALGVGYCSEDRKVEGIVPDMSVRENITLALLPRLTRAGVVDEARQRAIVDRFIARLAIKTANIEQKVRELSGGNQQKVLLARWLCTDPKLLILDEPTRGIDVGAKVEIQSLIKELADQGLGVLMISSELEEIVEGADRVFVLSDGRTVADLPHAKSTAPAIMAAMAHDVGLISADGSEHG